MEGQAAFTYIYEYYGRFNTVRSGAVDNIVDYSHEGPQFNSQIGFLPYLFEFCSFT